jgi:putative ABC transport system permease protein
MNLIIKNLLHVLRRFKLAAILNILGLSVAFAAFMIIIIQLDYHFGFDRSHENYDKIFRVDFVYDNNKQAVISRPLAESFFQSSSHIVAGAISDSYNQVMGVDAFFYVENNGARDYYREKIAVVSPEFTDVFTFNFVEGSKDALKTPNNVIIPLSLSRKLFGNKSAVGQQLIHSWGSQTVGAIYHDFPSNSSIENRIYVAINPDVDRNHWGNNIYNAFIRVDNAANAPLIMDNFLRDFDFQAVFGQDFSLEEAGMNMYLTALPDIHFLQDVHFCFVPKISRQTLMILFAIAIALIIIAGINFTNFTTALSPMRVKNINTQRVMGAQRRTIRWVIIFEAIAFSFVSYLVALLLVKFFADSMLANLVDADLSLSANPLVVIGTALITLLTGLFAGLYPAFYMTSFAPALVLKGSFGLSPKGKQLRNALIAVQYVASFVLIIGASFMYLQNRFMQNSDLGFDNDTLITVDIGQIQENRDAFTNQIKAYSGIDEVTYGFFLLSSSDRYMEWSEQYKGVHIVVQTFPVHHTFLEVMGIEITEGRNFRQEDADTEHGAWIFNESARNQFNLELNTSLESWVGGEIIGFMPNVKFASFRTAVEPMGFYVRGTGRNTFIQPNIAYIKLAAGTNLRAAMSHINATLAEFDPNFPFEIRFFDDVLQQLYEKELALSSLILLFSLIAIFISIVGVFGLVVFDSEYKRKEIGIRKVLGASATEIVIMFNKVYFKILAICFVVAIPLAWFAISRWLENFVHRTPMYWWVYLFALIAVAVVTVLTVTIQNWCVANDDPVKSIKTE